MENLEAGFTEQVANFREWSNRFSGAYRQFLAIPTRFRSPQWNEINNRAVGLQKTIDFFLNGISNALAWAKNVFGLSGLGLVIPAAPWLTVAAMGAAISAIMATYSYLVEELNRANVAKEKWEIDKARAAKGLEPLYPDIYRKDDKSLFGDIADIGKVAIIGGLLVVILPRVIDYIERGKK